jgi:hypothetical protein
MQFFRGGGVGGWVVRRDGVPAALLEEAGGGRAADQTQGAQPPVGIGKDARAQLKKQEASAAALQ